MFPFWNWNNIIINYCHYNFLNLSLMLFWVTSLNPTSTSHMHTHTTTFNTICHIGEHVASSFTTSKLTLFGIRIEKPSNNLILTILFHSCHSSHKTIFYIFMWAWEWDFCSSYIMHLITSSLIAIYLCMLSEMNFMFFRMLCF